MDEQDVANDLSFARRFPGEKIEGAQGEPQRQNHQRRVEDEEQLLVDSEFPHREEPDQQQGHGDTEYGGSRLADHQPQRAGRERDIPPRASWRTRTR